MRAGGTPVKFLLAIYTARYLSLSDLGIYGLLVGATTIVPAVFGLGMTDWVMRKIVDLPRAQALPLIASRLSLTLAIHLVVQPLAFAADILLGRADAAADRGAVRRHPACWKILAPRPPIC